MIRFRSQKQLTLENFVTPFETTLDKANRWVKLSQCLPWDELAEGYYQSLSQNKGRPAKDAQLVIGAVIIKHKLCLSDEETVQQIQENPYLQYFVGFPGYQTGLPFAPSLFVEIRRRMGDSVFEAFHRAIIGAVDQKKGKRVSDSAGKDDPDSSGRSVKAVDLEFQEEVKAQDSDEDCPQGKLRLDASVAEQAIRYPTDLSLLNEARELSERIIDCLFAKLEWKKKPRTYRQKARQAYLAVVKQRRPRKKVLRRGLKQQLQYLRRNLGHIERLLDAWPAGGLEPIPLPRWLLYRYWVIQHESAQQWEMYSHRRHRCDDRIVSLSQPHVRLIIRGKQHKPVEFGAKISVSLSEEGLASVDHLRWNAFGEGGDLPSQVEAYRSRYGHYPEVVLGDPVYGTRNNRDYLKARHIRFAGKPLGRPKVMTEENRGELESLKKQRREEYRQRIPIEGKFGQGKNGYRLGYIRAKRADTSAAWINSIVLVMNLLILLRYFLGFGKADYSKLVSVIKDCLRTWKLEFSTRLSQILRPSQSICS